MSEQDKLWWEQHNAARERLTRGHTGPARRVKIRLHQETHLSVP